MTRRYSPRRAGYRWTHDAPAFVLDCFHHPQFADCYTVWFGAPHAFHVLSDGSIRAGPNTYANTYITGIGTSANGGTSGALEYSAYDVAQYRYRNGHRRIAWRDLPDTTQALITRFIQE